MKESTVYTEAFHKHSEVLYYYISFMCIYIGIVPKFTLHGHYLQVQFISESMILYWLVNIEEMKHDNERGFDNLGLSQLMRDTECVNAKAPNTEHLL